MDSVLAVANAMCDMRTRHPERRSVEVVYLHNRIRCKPLLVLKLILSDDRRKGDLLCVAEIELRRLN
eukprot:1054319-Pleurochrysis_carterae.AAC.2